MGYTGLENWVQSDTAADMVYDAFANAPKALSRQLRSNEPADINTHKAFNVGMFVSCFLCHLEVEDIPYLDKFLLIAKRALKSLKSEINRCDKNYDPDEWDEESRHDHIRAYKKIAHKLERFIEKNT